MDFLEIAANRDQFTQKLAGIEFENRNALERIYGGERWILLLQSCQVNCLSRQRNPLFREKDPDSAGIGSDAGIVKLHGLSISTIWNAEGDAVDDLLSIVTWRAHAAASNHKLF